MKTEGKKRVQTQNRLGFPVFHLQIFMPPKLCCAQKNLFWTFDKTKIFPPWTFETWLRACAERLGNQHAPRTQHAFTDMSQNANAQSFHHRQRSCSSDESTSQSYSPPSFSVSGSLGGSTRVRRRAVAAESDCVWRGPLCAMLVAFSCEKTSWNVKTAWIWVNCVCVACLFVSLMTVSDRSHCCPREDIRRVGGRGSIITEYFDWKEDATSSITAAILDRTMFQRLCNSLVTEQHLKISRLASGPTVKVAQMMWNCNHGRLQSLPVYKQTVYTIFNWNEICQRFSVLTQPINDINAQPQ